MILGIIGAVGILSWCVGFACAACSNPRLSDDSRLLDSLLEVLATRDTSTRK